MKTRTLIALGLFASASMALAADAAVAYPTQSTVPGLLIATPPAPSEPSVPSEPSQTPAEADNCDVPESECPEVSDGV